MSLALNSLSDFMRLSPEGQMGLIALAGLAVAAYAIYAVSSSHRGR